MNLLIDPLPESVELGGQTWGINTAFFIGVQFELLMQDGTVPAGEKAGRALALYYPVIPADVSGAIHALLWFYRCGRDEEITGGQGTGNTRRAYCFDEDADRIYAAFLTHYQIDLNTVQNLHWWKFRALFRGLPETCELCKIMGYRTADLSGLPKSQKDFYKKMRGRYALKNEVSITAALSLAERNQRMRDHVAKQFEAAAGKVR